MPVHSGVGTTTQQGLCRGGVSNAMLSVVCVCVHWCPSLPCVTCSGHLLAQSPPHFCILFLACLSQLLLESPIPWGVGCVTLQRSCMGWLDMGYVSIVLQAVVFVWCLLFAQCTQQSNVECIVALQQTCLALLHESWLVCPCCTCLCSMQGALSTLILSNSVRWACIVWIVLPSNTTNVGGSVVAV